MLFVERVVEVERHPHSAHGSQAVAVQEHDAFVAGDEARLHLQDGRQKLTIGRREHISRNVRPAHEQSPMLTGELPQHLLHLRRESLVVRQRRRYAGIMLLESEYQVDGVVVLQVEQVGLEGFGRTAHNVVSACCRNRFGMGAHIVEGVASHILPLHLAAAEAQTTRSLDAHLSLVETLLRAAPSGRHPIGDAGIGQQVEAL